MTRHSNRTKLIALAAALCLALAAQAASADKTAGQTVDDSTIATSTKLALANSDLGSAGSINVEVHKGVVQLAGFIHSQDDRTTAIETARTVTGVSQVLDAMVVLEGKRSMGQTLDDTTIQTKLKAALTEVQGMADAFAINTEVRKGEVILSGFVADQETRNKAGEIAKGISGVTQVHNAIAIKP